jgi:protein phosphatase
MIADSETDQSVTPEAFDLLRFIAERRLAAGRLSVVDATNVHASARQRDLELAERCGVPAVAIVFDVATRICLHRNSQRTGRVVDAHVVFEQRRDLVEAMPLLAAEGFTAVYRLDHAAVDSVSVTRGNL